MTPFIANVFLSALSTIATTPQVEPDPALIAQLEQARPAAVGKNGADALYAIPQAPAGELTLFCNYDQADCLDAARENLAAYRAAAQQHQNAWQVQEKAIAALRQYEHFRYTTTLEGPLPPYNRIFQQRILAAYRFADGEKTAAIESLCTTTAVGLHLLNNDQNGLFPGLIATGLIAANTTMLAEMLAESPAGTRLPAACDEIKVQPAENLSLCTRMYSEWHIISEVLQKDMQEGLTKMPFTDEQYRELGVNFFPNTMLTSLFNQAEAYALQEFSRSCSAENRAAVARGELPNLTPDPSLRAQNCSPYNGLCIAAASWDYTRYQARLLNVNRYLTALDYLRHPTDTPPAGYHLENNTLTFTRYPDRKDEEGMQTVTLPLPGSRYNNPKAH
ncbi:hypothetical protein [Cardiobacterium hominis]|uniref:hypothetical protein n=2 Tax=Cardiobacterium hominis TaxID=2718 RepID=UPI00066134BF|nr:hypothetical protein [Cardiobacterium hominis]